MVRALCYSGLFPEFKSRSNNSDDNDGNGHIDNISNLADTIVTTAHDLSSAAIVTSDYEDTLSVLSRKKCIDDVCRNLWGRSDR